MFGDVSRELKSNFNEVPSGLLTLLLIGIGLTYIAIGVFVQNHWVKAGAAAYGLLP